LSVGEKKGNLERDMRKGKTEEERERSRKGRKK